MAGQGPRAAAVRRADRGRARHAAQGNDGRHAARKHPDARTGARQRLQVTDRRGRPVAGADGPRLARGCRVSEQPTGRPSLPEFEVAILGAGFGGLCMGIKLLEAGIRNFVILEKDHEVGGTWRDNTYPGAACDVQPHLYSYSFDGKPDWSQRYAGWREIEDYILATTDKHGLRPYIRFGCTVNSAHFDSVSGCWAIGTQAGETLTARHFVLAAGPLHRPQI